MPSSPGYGEVVKYCLRCTDRLVLRNTRDIVRKNFCSAECRGAYGARGRKRTLPERTCICGEKFRPWQKNHEVCSTKCYAKKQVQNSYKYLNGNFNGYVLHLLKKNGRKHLTVHHIQEIYDLQKGLCAISKLPLTLIKIPNTKKVHTNLSIDRIDSTKGYEIENIQLVCAVVNTMKLNLSLTEFTFWIGAIHGGLENS